MAKTRPPNPAEFRRHMIELVRTGGKTPAELSCEFECTAPTIINWVAQAARDESRPRPDKEGLCSAEREELVWLRQQVRQLGWSATAWQRLWPSASRRFFFVRLS